MLSNAELRALAIFRQFLMGPGQMLCFPGPLHTTHKNGLQKLMNQGMVIKESFKDGYSLTETGYEAMRANG